MNTTTIALYNSIVDQIFVWESDHDSLILLLYGIHMSKKPQWHLLGSV